MFTTFRNDGNTPLRVDSVRSAHESVRRPACKSCHSKKLRCTREKDGCKRCLSRHITCEYERSSRSGTRPSRHSNSLSAGIDHLAENVSTTEDVPEPQEPQEPQDNLNDAPLFSAEKPETSLIGTCSAQNNTFSPGVPTKNNVLFDFLNDDFDESFNEFTVLRADLGEKESDFTLPASQHFLDTPRSSNISPQIAFGLSQNSSGPCPIGILSNILTGSRPKPTSNLPSPSSSLDANTTNPCHCLQTALSLLEAISLDCVQTTLHSVPRAIRLNKLALARCRVFLSCNTCSTKSSFLLLLITLCQKMISSYSLTIMLLTEQFNRIHSPVEGRASTPIPSVESTMAAAQKLEVSMKEYEVDLEEEPCVFGGVVQLQLKKIGVFLGVLREVLRASNWSSHIAMLDTVCDQVKELLRCCTQPCHDFN